MQLSPQSSCQGQQAAEGRALTLLQQLSHDTEQSEPACVAAQAGPPYELDPHTLETKAGRPSSLDGWVPVGKAPSTTGSFVLDKVRARAHLKRSCKLRVG